MSGFHRRDEHKRWKIERWPITRDQIRPFQIMLSRKRTMISSIITNASSTDGRAAWVSHAGQIMEDGKTVSEAVYPEHIYTPIDYYLDKYRKGKLQLTIIEFRPGIYPDEEIKRIAQNKCQEYHLGLEGESYDVGALFPMLMVSIIRNTFPFLKRGAWIHIPKSKAEEVLVCSGEIDIGWWWLQKTINHDIFPSTLSLRVPSPQDLWESRDTRFVGGCKKVYI